jgi:hypothetical protein
LGDSGVRWTTGVKASLADALLLNSHFNFLYFSRSRRKEVNKENRNNANTGVNQPTGNKKTGVVSASQSASTKSRKTPLSENCVAASFDDDMIERLTKVPCGVDRNEWLATHSKLLNLKALYGF